MCFQLNFGLDRLIFYNIHRENVDLFSRKNISQSLSHFCQTGICIGFYKYIVLKFVTTCQIEKCQLSTCIAELKIT